MKYAKIVLVAQWDGWCGACADERPLVLTRTGRQRLRTWLAGAADDSRPLVLTCRLCGTGVPVPLEQDDPPVVVSEQEPEPLPGEPATAVEAPHEQPAAAPATVALSVPGTALTTGRQAVAQALGALVAQRSAAAAVQRQAPGAEAAPTVVPALPLQRTPSSGGLAELQLLADGIDLLSSGRT